MGISAAFLISVSPLWAQEAGVGVRVREWLAGYDGAITADGRPDNGTRLDAASGLGLDDSGFAHEIQASVDVPGVGRFQAGYERLRLDGERVLDADTNFDGHLFPAGTSVDAALGFDVLHLDCELPVLKEPVELGFLAGARYVSGEADLEGGGIDAHANLNRPLLLPGARAGVELSSWLQAGTRLQGLAFSAHNVRARYLEWDAELSASPAQGFSVSVGYRQVFLNFKAREGSLNFDLDGALGGLFLAVAYRF
jgi:hypothetical protein